jgi:nitrate/nitrite-specific signal transduction histidine kinase
VGLALLCILLVLLPLYLLRPVDHLVWKLKEVYEKGFNKKVELKKGHEMKQLEEIVEKIVDELKNRDGVN